MEDMATFAGNLLAELDVIRDEARTGIITKEVALERMAVIGRRARRGREEWAASKHPQPQPEGALHI